MENVILKNEKVEACCVVGVLDTEYGYGQSAIAYIVCKNNDSGIVDEVRALCTNELSEKYCPKEYRIIDTLPLTSNGKIDYKALEKMKKD